MWRASVDGVLRQMLTLWWLPIDFYCPQCSAVTTLIGLFIPWCCPYMIYASSVPCSMIFGSVSRWQTWPNVITCDAWWPTVKVPDVQRRYWPAAKSYVISIMCQASSCSISFQMLGFASPGLPSTSSVGQKWILTITDDYKSYYKYYAILQILVITINKIIIAKKKKLMGNSRTTQNRICQSKICQPSSPASIDSVTIVSTNFGPIVTSVACDTWTSSIWDPVDWSWEPPTKKTKVKLSF